jgi:hypothetical protein
MRIKSIRQQITDWFDNLVKLFPNRGVQTQKGVEHTSPSTTTSDHLNLLPNVVETCLQEPFFQNFALS